MKVGGVRVRLADRSHVRFVLLGILAIVLRRQPVLALVRPEIPPFRTRSTWRGEIVSTMPRVMTSSASSRGVQWVTGRPLSPGGSQATAMICTNCSAVKVAGAPGRLSSARTASISVDRSLADGPLARPRQVAHGWLPNESGLVAR